MRDAFNAIPDPTRRQLLDVPMQVKELPLLLEERHVSIEKANTAVQVGSEHAFKGELDVLPEAG